MPAVGTCSDLRTIAGSTAKREHPGSKACVAIGSGRVLIAGEHTTFTLSVSQTCIMLLNPAESWNMKGIGVLDLFILFLFYSVRP